MHYIRFKFKTPFKFLHQLRKVESNEQSNANVVRKLVLKVFTSMGFIRETLGVIMKLLKKS